VKLLCVIDHFGSGGAQRQMINLALGLKARGHDVAFFVYFPDQVFFRPQVEAAGIAVHTVTKGRGFSPNVVWALFRHLRAGRYDAAISFLGTPNIYLEMARLPLRRLVVVASERSSNAGDRNPRRAWLARNWHRLADAVVANSSAHSDWLRQGHSWLRHKVVTIRNGTDIARFARPFEPPKEAQQIRLLAVGRVGPEKNVRRLTAALTQFHREHGWAPAVTWVGRRADHNAAGRAYLAQVDADMDVARAAASPVRIDFLGERSDVPDLLGQHHALIHPSLHEGLPNAVCEALAAGRPVIASDISDVAILVAEGRRGFLFDPENEQEMVAAMARLAALTPEQWRTFSKDSRTYAAENLSIDNMVTSFESLVAELVAKRRGRG